MMPPGRTLLLLPDKPLEASLCCLAVLTQSGQTYDEASVPAAAAAAAAAVCCLYSQSACTRSSAAATQQPQARIP